MGTIFIEDELLKRSSSGILTPMRDGDVIQSSPIAEMYLLSNTTASVIDTADKWHVLSVAELTAGALIGWTYVDGVRGTDIAAYATSDVGARTKVTTTADNALALGDYITITGTTHYNDIYEIMEIVDSKNFTIDKTWDTHDDGTGTYARGGTLTSGDNTAGYYSAAWNTTISPATNANIYTMGFMVNKTPCDKCRARQKLASTTGYNTMAGNTILEISVGDKVSFIIKNVGGTADYTIRHGNADFHRI